MKKFTFIIVLIATLIACKNEPEENENPQDSLEAVDLEFEAKKFSKLELDLLKELDICVMTQSDSSLVATCSPENFELIEINTQKGLQDIFLLQTKAGIVLKGQQIPLPLRHILIFEREQGKLVKVNGMRGELIGMEDQPGGYKNLIVAIYSKADDSMFQCVFTWKDSKYSFDYVRAIDWGEGPKAIKAELRDSVSADIYKSLMENNLLF